MENGKTKEWESDMKVMINYELEAPSLVDALRTALDLHASAGITPKSIDCGISESLAFCERDARRVVNGTLSESFYRGAHSFGASFGAWASWYFSPLEDHLDCAIPLDDALEDYRFYSSNRMMSPVMFMKKLRDFARDCEYILEMNPRELCVVKPDEGMMNGRILKRRVDENGERYGGAVDHIFMKTNPDVYAKVKAECEAVERDFLKEFRK